MNSEKQPIELPRWILLLFPVVGLIVAAVMVEGAFRMLRPTDKPKKWSDRPFAYFMPEDAVDLQDRPPHPKEPGTFRVAVVGDSFTFGPHLQLDSTYPKQLERFLNTSMSSGHRVEVLNRGVSGTSTNDQVQVVQRALKEGLDLLILEITLNDAEPHPLTREEKSALFDWKHAKSPLFRVWSSLGFLLARLHNSETHRAYIRYHTDFFKQQQTFAVFNNALQQISASAKAAGVPLVAVVYPMFDFPFDDAYPFAEAHSIVDNALRSNKISYLDLRDAYTGIPPERLQVIPGGDNHPNEIALRIGAERTVAFLALQKLVPDWSIPKRLFRARKDLKSKAAHPEAMWQRYGRGSRPDAPVARKDEDEEGSAESDPPAEASS